MHGRNFAGKWSFKKKKKPINGGSNLFCMKTGSSGVERIVCRRRFCENSDNETGEETAQRPEASPVLLHLPAALIAPVRIIENVGKWDVRKTGITFGCDDFPDRI